MKLHNFKDVEVRDIEDMRNTTLSKMITKQSRLADSLVYEALREMRPNSDGMIFFKQTDLGEAFNLSRKQVRASLKSLQENGWIEYGWANAFSLVYGEEDVRTLCTFAKILK